MMKRYLNLDIDKKHIINLVIGIIGVYAAYLPFGIYN